MACCSMEEITLLGIFLFSLGIAFVTNGLYSLNCSFSSLQQVKDNTTEKIAFDIIFGLVWIISGLVSSIYSTNLNGIKNFVGFSSYFLVFFIVSVILFRRFYLKKEKDNRRLKDKSILFLLVIPSTGGVLGSISSIAFNISVVISLIAGCVSIGWLLLDSVKLIRGKQIYKRDFLYSLLILLLTVTFTFTLIAFLVSGMPP